MQRFVNRKGPGKTWRGMLSCVWTAEADIIYITKCDKKMITMQFTTVYSKYLKIISVNTDMYIQLNAQRKSNYS